MNKVILMGRLTRDPDVRQLQNAADPEHNLYARYTLAVDRRMRRDPNNPDQQTADFISCVAYGRQAEFTNNYMRQGGKYAIAGHIQTGSYTNKDGQKVYTTDVIVEQQEFCESKGTGANSGNQAANAAQTANNPAGHAENIPGVQGFMNIPDSISEELPFA